jgi:hypothetical protein
MEWVHRYRRQAQSRDGPPGSNITLPGGTILSTPTVYASPEERRSPIEAPSALRLTDGNPDYRRQTRGKAPAVRPVGKEPNNLFPSFGLGHASFVSWETPFVGSCYATSPSSRMRAYWYRPLSGVGDYRRYLGSQLALPAGLPKLCDLPDPDQRHPLRLSATISEPACGGSTAEGNGGCSCRSWTYSHRLVAYLCSCCPCALDQAWLRTLNLVFLTR